LSIVAATVALEDQTYARGTWANIKAERTRVTAELTSLGWLVLPSQANFLLATVPSGRGEEMYLGLKAQGILVRYFDLPGLQDKLRITIGHSHENNALLAGIKMLTASEQGGVSRILHLRQKLFHCLAECPKPPLGGWGRGGGECRLPICICRIGVRREKWGIRESHFIFQLAVRVNRSNMRARSGCA